MEVGFTTGFDQNIWIINSKLFYYKVQSVMQNSTAGNQSWTNVSTVDKKKTGRQGALLDL